MPIRSLEGITARARRFAARARDGDRPPAPFIVGVPRSGTTLLRLMLDAHSELAIPPETHFLPKLIKAAADGASRDDVVELVTTHRRWPDFELEPDELRSHLDGDGPLDPGDAARALYRAYAAKRGKPRWGEKTPQYLKTMGRISRALPEARFVHLIRDGRDVALSLLSVDWGPASVGEAAELWSDQIRRARRKAPSLPHYAEIRYEALLADPEAVVREVCEQVELDFEPAMLDYHGAAADRMSAVAREFEIAKGPTISAAQRARQHELVSEPPRADRAGRWRERMSPADVEAFESVAGPLLAELGYEPSA